MAGRDGDVVVRVDKKKRNGGRSGWFLIRDDSENRRRSGGIAAEKGGTSWFLVNGKWDRGADVVTGSRNLRRGGRFLRIFDEEDEVTRGRAAVLLLVGGEKMRSELGLGGR
ncbi:hypothetical protein HAX54_033466 [Datura stramonium]|uniref:Uncharacterized protein n=1 Tax=Datura stramonium TaxID=4076 RepID=A0ABS8VF73_DATST|nr:hypothetical protein [Datura stramonium]